MLSQTKSTGIIRAAPWVHQRGWVWALGVVALAVGSALLWLPYLNIPLDIDAAVYATAAYWWARGDTLYQNFTITRPQGIFVVFRLIQAVGLGSVRGIHIVAAVYCALCALALLAVASRVWGRGIGFGAAALFALVMATPHLEGPTANAELFMTLPLLSSLYLVLRADERTLGSRSGLWLLAGAGLLGAVALLVKPAAVAIAPLAMLWIVRRWRVEGTPGRLWLRAEVVFGGGFLLGLLPALIHGLMTVPQIYLDTVLFYRVNKDSVASASLDSQLVRFVSHSSYIIVRLPILLVAAVGLAVTRPHVDSRQRDLLWLWLLTSLGGAALGANWHVHYYQQLLPPVVIAVSLGLRVLLRRPRHVAHAVLQGVAGAGVVFLGLTLVSVLTPPADPAKLVLQYSNVESPLLFPTEAVAAYLREHAAPADTVYVAYQQPAIYYLAQRQPAGRWPDIPDIVDHPGAFDEQVALLADPITAPRYIVGAQPFDVAGLDADGRLRAVVARDYTQETTIGGIPLYHRNK